MPPPNVFAASNTALTPPTSPFTMPVIMLGTASASPAITSGIASMICPNRSLAPISSFGIPSASAVAMVVMISGSAFASATIMSGNASKIAINSFMLPSIIKGIPVISPFTIASMICGSAFISASIIVGIASTIAISIVIAPSIISGIAFISASIMFVMISGSAFTIATITCGIASTIPQSSCMPASIIIGIFCISIFTMPITTSTICGSNVGSACAIPCASVTMISTPACKICGKASSSTPISWVAVFSTTSISVGSACVIPSTKAASNVGNASKSAVPTLVIAFKIVGTACDILFTMPVMPSLIFSPAVSFPAIRSLKPSITLDILGKKSPISLFFKPLKVPCKRVKLSSNAALAATASSLITMPYASASSISSLMPSLPLLSSGKSSAALFPKISLAAALRAVSSSIAASASMLSISTCSVLFKLPSVFLRDTPSAANLLPAPSTPCCALPSSSVMFFTPFLRSSMLLPLRSQA